MAYVFFCERSRTALFVSFFAVQLAIAPVNSGETNNRINQLGADFQITALPCNSGSFSQVPGSNELFVGRRMVTSGQGQCDGDHFEIILERMDWGALKLEYIKTVFSTPSKIWNGATVSTAIDPAVVYYRGKYWIAFECSGNDIPSSSICIGSIDLNNGLDTIDPKKTRVLIAGVPFGGAGAQSLTASVPKLLLHQGRLYIYWDAVLFWREPPEGLVINRLSDRWISIAQRGAELEYFEEDETLRVKGLSGPLASDDPEHSTEVWGPVPGDPRSDTTVDVYDVFAYGSTIIALGNVGGNGCVTPLDSMPGCYRRIIAVSSEPLGHHVFNRLHLSEEMEPNVPQGYARFVKKPNGEFGIITLQYGLKPALLLKSDAYVKWVMTGSSK